MTATAAIAQSLLKGDVLTIKDAFNLFGVTNLPRELGRSIERKFGLKISKIRRKGNSRYGVSCTWFEYHLNWTEYNLEGIKRMREYVNKQTNGKSSSTSSGNSAY